jgi:hypothetical protein
MTELSATRQPAVISIIRVLIVFDTIALLFGAALHVAGASIPLGLSTFNEPQIVPAAIVEGLAGLIFLVSCYAVFTNKAWAWTSAMVAHMFAILGFIVGILATLNGTSPFNAYYHRVMLAIFVVGLLLLLTGSARAALGRGERAI